MKVEHIEILVEEPSMESALRVLLPRMLKEISFEVHPYQGKSDLLQRLPERLVGYASWLPATHRIVVLIDRDDDDCKKLKRQLEKIARDAGLVTKTTAGSRPYQVVNRLAIEELEAWYFGDWEAVRTAYPRVPATIPRKAGFRVPDAIKGGTWEALERILQQAGHLKGRLRKIETARIVAKHMAPSRNSSRSFCVLREALEKMSSPTVH
ncbi:MAG: DUF4276 family protein [Deltaproteobacteria bacterium]|nr:DUF4276 family protein [Deltaproteobacteria bacterium]